jgi:hypothetical protein
MTHLTFSGIRNHKRVTITWEDGKLSGHAPTVAWIRRYAVLLEGHLADPYVAAEIIRSIYPGAVTMEGELPLREVPPGAVQ